MKQPKISDEESKPNIDFLKKKAKNILAPTALVSTVALILLYQNQTLLGHIKSWTRINYQVKSIHACCNSKVFVNVCNSSELYTAVAK